MNKLCLASLLLSLFAAGCGKKKVDMKKDTKKTMASSDAPLFADGSELAENADLVSDFAFVDDEVEGILASAEDKASNVAHEAAGQNELLVSTDQQTLADGQSFKRVQFDFNKNNIRHDQVEVVQADVQAAKEAVKEGKHVVVQGHTCMMGSASYNMALSQRRADAVKKEMVKAGIDGEQVKTIGFGYEHPLVWTDATDRETKIRELSPNRRAEVIVQ